MACTEAPFKGTLERRFSSAGAACPQQAAPLGQVYTWGFCTHGQLGLKEKILGAREYVETPTHVGAGSALADVEVKAAACGHFHTLVVDVRGNVYAFGRDDRGQLGRSAEASSIEGHRPGHMPRCIKSLATYVVMDVACGAFHCLALTADGALLSWGWNQHGQLGRSTGSSADPSPASVQDAGGEVGPVRSFAAGFAHSAATFASGKLAAWGGNRYGQLGTGGREESTASAVFANDVLAAKVAAGDNHVVVLTLDDRVLAAGDHRYGQLGPDFLDSSGEVQPGIFANVPGLPLATDAASDHVCAVFSSGVTNAAVTQHGRLFTWGGGVWGQLGRGARSDQPIPGIVRGLPRVVSVALAQDHMLAVCTDAESRGATSLWCWGRRRLLPSGAGNSAGEIGTDAQCVPAMLPLRLLGRLGPSCGGEGGARLRLQVACGGSHSLVFGSCQELARQAKRYVAVRCPRTTIVTGSGTRGGRVSEPLPFTIISRNEDGRDEKVGGLRFQVFARLATARRRSRGSAHRSEEEDRLDRCNFDLLRLSDCCDGTYEGTYTVRIPGTYLLHVHMLPTGVEASPSCETLGEPVSGSPFRVSVDSGPAFAGLCALQLRSGGKSQRGREGAGSGPRSSRTGAVPGGRPGVGTAPGVRPAAQSFVVEACSGVVWDILAFDVLGNPGTLRTDRFSVSLDCCATEGRAGALAKRLAVQPGGAGAGGARVPPARPGPRGSQGSTAQMGAPPHVRPAKEPGRSEIHWSPGSVGEYRLAVSLLGAGPEPGEPLAGSPFTVRVVAGAPSAPHSRLVVGVPGPGEVAMQGDQLTAELPVQLLLCDRLGNSCEENLDPLRCADVRVENTTLLGVDDTGPAALLEWQVTKTCDEGSLTLALHATAALLKAAAGLAPNSNGECRCTVQFFVSAADRASRQRLLGSPCRVQLQVAIPASTVVKLEPAPVLTVEGTITQATQDGTPSEPPLEATPAPQAPAVREASPAAEALHAAEDAALPSPTRPATAERAPVALPPLEPIPAASRPTTPARLGRPRSALGQELGTTKVAPTSPATEGSGAAPGSPTAHSPGSPAMPAAREEVPSADAAGMGALVKADKATRPTSGARRHAAGTAGAAVRELVARVLAAAEAERLPKQGRRCSSVPSLPMLPALAPAQAQASPHPRLATPPSSNDASAARRAAALPAAPAPTMPPLSQELPAATLPEVPAPNSLASPEVQAPSPKVPEASCKQPTGPQDSPCPRSQAQRLPARHAVEDLAMSWLPMAGLASPDRRQAAGGDGGLPACQSTLPLRRRRLPAKHSGGSSFLAKDEANGTPSMWPRPA